MIGCIRVNQHLRIADVLHPIELCPYDFLDVIGEYLYHHLPKLLLFRHHLLLFLHLLLYLELQVRALHGQLSLLILDLLSFVLLVLLNLAQVILLATQPLTLKVEHLELPTVLCSEPLKFIFALEDLFLKVFAAVSVDSNFLFQMLISLLEKILDISLHLCQMICYLKHLIVTNLEIALITN